MSPKGQHIAAAVFALLLSALTGRAGEPLKLSKLHWDFESGTLEGWTVVWGNLGKQPSSNDNDRHGGSFNKHGKYFIGTYEDRAKPIGDQVTGELRSPVFVVDAERLAMMVGGGKNIATTYVALCDADNGQELLKAAGKDAEAMAEVVWDVSKSGGKRLYLKVVDRPTRRWGHINLDNVRAITKDEAARIQRDSTLAQESKKRDPVAGYQYYMGQCSRAKKARDMPGVERAVFAALQYGPGDEYAWRTLAWAQAKQGKWQDSLSNANENVRRHGVSGWSMSQLAESALGAGDFEQARKALQQADALPRATLNGSERDLQDCRKRLLAATSERTDALRAQGSKMPAPEERVAANRFKAGQGDAASQYQLGLAYMYGNGVEKDYGQAAAWFRKGAEQGYPLSQTSLGHMYEYGQGVAQDYDTALSLYRKAVAQNELGAMVNMGFAYARGHGVPKDEGEALAWYRKAAEKGHPFSQFLVGNAYEKGQGVPQDESEAASWYRKAAEKGYAPAQTKLGYLYTKGLGVPRDDHEAAIWLGKAAERMSPGVQNTPVPANAQGVGATQDREAPGTWSRRLEALWAGWKAAARGDAQDQTRARLFRSFIAAVVIESLALVGWIIMFLTRRQSLRRR